MRIPQSPLLEGAAPRRISDRAAKCAAAAAAFERRSRPFPSCFVTQHACSRTGLDCARPSEAATANKATAAVSAAGDPLLLRNPIFPRLYNAASKSIVESARNISAQHLSTQVTRRIGCGVTIQLCKLWVAHEP